jgi:hypothetical protein
MGLLRQRRVRAASVGLLCAIAATVAVWSGPLSSATAGFHGSDAHTATVHARAASHGLK